jgi:uncharacterized protein
MVRRISRPFVLFGVALVLVVVWLSITVLSANPAGPLGAFVDNLSTLTTIFLGIIIEGVPYLILGTLASGLLEVYFDQDDLHRLIPRNPLGGAIVGAMLGMFFPVCECGSVPLARRLFKKGLPVSVGVSFLLAAPVMNPIVIASTAAAFGWGKILFLRVGLTVFIAVVTGVIFATQKHPEQLLNASAWAGIRGGSDALPLPGTAVASSFVRPSLKAGIPKVMEIAVDEFFEMGRFLVLGSLIAALVQTIVPQSFLLQVSNGPVLSVIAMMALAVVLSICSTVDAFIALAFANVFSTGSVLAFLVFGPMVDFKSTLLFLQVFKPKAVMYLILLPMAMTILFSVFINLNTTW